MSQKIYSFGGNAEEENQSIFSRNNSLMKRNSNAYFG
jgi:hypothetical protein